MEIFRISLEEYSTELTSSGSANRWNFKGEKVLYTGQQRSLSTLELTVHSSSVIPVASYKVMVISVADSDELIKQVQRKDLPPNWREVSAYPALQKMGSAWYKSQESLILKVPSAIIVQEYNYIINIEHPDFDKNVTLVRTEDYFWDRRLLTKTV